MYINNSFKINNQNKIQFKSKEKILSNNSPQTKTIKMSIYNPYDDTHCEGNIKFNKNEKQDFLLQGKKHKWINNKLHTILSEIKLNYNPTRKDYIYDKEKKKPIETIILKSSQENTISYHFISNNLKKEYGYVKLLISYNPEKDIQNVIIDKDLYKNYPKQKITGARIIVDYIQNWNDKKYGGIGKLADKMEVQLCQEKNIAPVIISIADINSYAAHYKRGKRFLPIPPQNQSYKFYEEKYKTTNINKILASLIKRSNETHTHIDFKGWGYLLMYMPQKLIKKYLK